MRVGYKTLLITSALFAVADASSGHSDTMINTISETAIANSRFLRVYRTEEEERVGFPSSFIEQAKAMVTTVSTEKLASWLNKGKPIDDVFTRLHLAKAGDKLLDSPQFLPWLNYADDLTSKTGQEASAIATLTTHYGDDALAKILEAAKKVEKTEGIAARLETAQIQRWLDGGNTADDVFKLLKLDKAGDDVLLSPLINTWTTYQQAFNKANPAKKTTLYATLTAHYGDAALARMIEAAKKAKGTSGLAKRVEATLLQTWLGSKQTPDDVFKLLKLDNAADDVLASPALNVWTNFLNAFNKENPDKTKTLIETLTIHYGDRGVYRMLDAAKKVETTKSIAMNLETAQIQLWLGNRKTPASVFGLLKLDEAGNNLLVSPEFATFTKFTDAFHAKNPNLPISRTFAQYKDFDLVKMILAAEKNPTSAKAAKWMEGVLFKGWLDSKSPDFLFSALRLNEVKSGKLFEDPVFLYWMNFMDDFNKAFSAENIERTVLATTYKDKDLWRAVQAAKKNPETSALASKVETEVLKQFIFANKQPNDVAKLMNVRKQTDLNWSLWDSYAKDYKKYHLVGMTT